VNRRQFLKLTSAAIVLPLVPKVPLVTRPKKYEQPGQKIEVFQGSKRVISYYAPFECDHVQIVADTFIVAREIGEDNRIDMPRFGTIQSMTVWGAQGAIHMNYSCGISVSSAK
jgi:hypothetical protein